MAMQFRNKNNINLNENDAGNYEVMVKFTCPENIVTPYNIRKCVIPNKKGYYLRSLISKPNQTINNNFSYNNSNKKKNNKKQNGKNDKNINLNNNQNDKNDENEKDDDDDEVKHENELPSYYELMTQPMGIVTNWSGFNFKQLYLSSTCKQLLQLPCLTRPGGEVWVIFTPRPNELALMISSNRFELLEQPTPSITIDDDDDNINPRLLFQDSNIKESLNPLL
jgi:hypothetical protein